MSFEEKRDKLIQRLERRDISEHVLTAMRAVPRHKFVPENQQEHAYQDRPLSIGEGQTISAPHMVAEMVDLLELEDDTKVLEIGTGCGYHAAVTAEVVGADNVYSVEYSDTLATEAKERLSNLGYAEISIRQGDGHQGWEEHAPYDRVYLTCAASSIPQLIVDQLRVGGIFLGPIGTYRQELVRGEKHDDGRLEQSTHGYVRFVQMKGE
ncbi:MAG: protein-L-isoaspartate(D-aspartate) O-methyltransferase [Halobacteriaceae archaeon]